MRLARPQKNHMKKAIYPGSFDPVTNGHVDIVKRALTIVDELIIGILDNKEKSPVFSVNERKEHIEAVFPETTKVKVIAFQGLLVDFARQNNISVVIRGLRAASDFEYEFQLAAMNRCLDKDFETIFLMTGSETYFLSSRLVKEIAFFGGDVHKMVPKHVEQALKQKRANMRVD
jgi:pantetheine-phosphate adenylyltransferase